MNAIEFDHVSKQYRLGLVSTKTLSHDIRRFWLTNVLGKEDPYLKIGETNDRASKGSSDYVWALKDITFNVEQGDVVGIIGKNGAGKSTLLKLLSRVTGPTTGQIRAHGRIGSLLEVGTGFHQEMTGRENIFMNGAILGMTRSEIQRKLDEIVDFSGCERYIDTPVKRYSSGMMVRLGFAVAAHLDPEILVVDEVLAVGDAEFQKKAIGKMQDVSKGEGRTVLFVSHNMASIRNLCNRGVLLENGMVKKMGTADEVVGEYVAGNLVEAGDVKTVSEGNFRRIGASRQDFEIINLRRLSSYLMDNSDSIRYAVTLRRNNSKKNKFKITTMIDNVANGGFRVGMAESGDVEWPIGQKEAMFEVEIPTHNLTWGKYILDVWATQGGVNSLVETFDAVYDTLTFEVHSFRNKEITNWYSYWGETLCNQQVKLA